MKIGGPAGIGDLSWLYSKLCTLDEPLDYLVADGWPYRAKEYMELLPKVASVEYGKFEYQDILEFEEAQRANDNPLTSWKAVCNLNGTAVLLQPNLHLERGKPLKEWMPDLETDYHYSIQISADALNEATKLLAHVERGVGISCASYRGAKAWKTWDFLQWKELCDHLVRAGHRLVFMGGGWDDLTRSVALEFENHTDLVGKTTFEVACAVHKQLPFYVGFSSGLGIIRTVLGLPTMMLWPDHQQPLSTSWADPDDLSSRRYVATPYMEPSLIARLFFRQVEDFHDG